MEFSPTRILTLSFAAKFLIAKVIGRVYCARLPTYEFPIRKIIEHGESLMDLYTQEDMRRDKRMAIFKYAAVTTVAIASFLALTTIHVVVFTA